MSSKRRLRRNACIGKVRHKTMEGALVHIRRVNAIGKLHVYRCGYCSAFHVGHRPKRVRDAIDRKWSDG